MSVRQDALNRLAYEMGMSYQAHHDWGLETQLADFRLFHRGRAKTITHVLHRQGDMLDLDVRIFDYEYIRGYGKNRRKRRQTVFFMESKKLGLPQFFMKPEHFLHKIGQWLNLQEDIDFEEYPVFSRQYFLKGEEEDFVRAAFSDQILRFFSNEKNWTLEGLNYYVLFYRHNKLLRPKEIRSFYNKGLKVCEWLHQSAIW